MINYIGEPKKELGQNFLTDLEIVQELVAASEPGIQDSYLEIGPGEGAVTQILAPKVKQILAIEFDRDLIPGLKKNLSRFSNVEIINADILNYLEHQMSIVNCQLSKIVGSIPYQITSPLLHQLTELCLKTKIDSVVLLVQKEVAEKIAAQPPEASYLSTFIRGYFAVKIIRNVSRQSFHPVPKVDGAIIKLVPSADRLMPGPSAWSAFLHRGFQHPRKMLKKVFDEKILLAAGVRPEQRPQEITRQQWLQIKKFYDAIRTA